MLLPNGTQPAIPGRGRTVNLLERRTGDLRLLVPAENIAIIGPGVRAKQMRIGLGHLLGLPQTEIERATGFGQQIGPAETTTVGPAGQEGAEVTLETAIETHGGGSRFPFLDLLNVFVVRDVLDGGNEADLADGLFDLAAEGGGQGIQARGGQPGQIPFAQFVFDGGQAFGEGSGALLARAQQAVLEVVQFEGTLVLEFKTELAAPLDKGAFGDAQFAGNADQGPALGATLDEFLTDFRCVHGRVIAQVLEGAVRGPNRVANRDDSR